MKREWRVPLMLVCLALALSLAFAAWQRHRTMRPEVRGFSKDTRSWQAYGGAWELDQGVMRNSSDERGAKLVTGSTEWKDYSIDSDVTLLGAFGDAGVLMRARDVDQGVDSYRGYFAGMRNEDDTLILGRSDYGWEEYRSLQIAEGLHVGTPYHLHVVMVGCTIAASVARGGTVIARTAIEIERCVPSGQAGLQSYQTPAAWTNFQVRPATAADLQETIAGERVGSARNGDLHRNAPELPLWQGILRDEARRSERTAAVPIQTLQLLPQQQRGQITVHGVVRLLSPQMYVEDSTGGIPVQPPVGAVFATGDEIEATGSVSQQHGHPLLVAQRVRQFSSEMRMPPRIAAAYEAATGELDNRLVTLEGTVRRTWRMDPDRLVLELQSGGEIFRAIARTNGYGAPLPKLQPRCELQITGVVTSDQAWAGDSAFALLVSANQDSIRLLQAAPWWTPYHIALLAAVVLTATIAALRLAHRLKQRALWTVLAEREMLAHDLHDTVAQSFAGIGYQLGALESSIPPGAPKATLARAQEMVRQSHLEFRRSITTLRSEVHEMNDLAEGLRRQALRMIEGGAMRIECSCHGRPQRIPLKIADCFFRVGQEAIANSVMHANASLLSIHLKIDRRRLHLSISDNGFGIPADLATSNSGLYGMHKRAESIGASLKVESNEHGTSILLDCALTSPMLARRERSKQI